MSLKCLSYISMYHRKHQFLSRDRRRLPLSNGLDRVGFISLLKFITVLVCAQISPGRSKEPVQFQTIYEGFVISGICSVKIVSIVPSLGVTTFCATAYSV
jgi:hypothetical protein